MLKWFICPDGQRIEVKDCLKEGGCRMGDRCATRSYLQMCAKERPWTGKPSTTQLINGTMLAFLKLTKDFATSPDSRAFMIHGTKGHANLEAATDEFSQLELRFDGEDIDETGIADVVETEIGKVILSDYKTSGSYKIMKALGFTVKDELIDGEFYKSGKRKGEQKTRKVLVRDDKAVDRWEWEQQLNKYRIEYERLSGKKVDELKIQCVVRDGGTFIARSRGVFRNIYYFKITIMPDEIVLAYFKRKREALALSMKQGYWNNVCTKEENWDGLRCARYCEVAEYCKLGKYLNQQKEIDNMPIKGLSEIRRLPRLGKIRLGIKVLNSKNVEHPKEVDYFVFDPQTPSELENKKLKDEFHKLYGEKPKQIQIMFPVADPKIFFPQDYKRYGGSLLKCKGDGETAVCSMPEYAEGLKIIGKNELGNTKVECKGKECIYHKSRKCSEVGTLQVLLPELPGAGVWQIVTGSFHSIVNVNSCIDYIRATCGRAHMIPLTLERRQQATSYEGKKATHYVLHINMDFKLRDLQKLANIDPTRITMELPEIEADKEDILFGEHKRIEPESTGKEESPTKVEPSDQEKLVIELEEWADNISDEKDFMEWRAAIQHNMKKLTVDQFKNYGEKKLKIAKEKGWKLV